MKRDRVFALFEGDFSRPLQLHYIPAESLGPDGELTGDQFALIDGRVEVTDHIGNHGKVYTRPGGDLLDEQGNVLATGLPFVLPSDVPIPVPASISIQSAELYLIQLSLLDRVEAALDAIPNTMQRQTAKSLWKRSKTILRNGQFIPPIQAALGWTDEQVDTMFIKAAGIDAAAVARGQ